MRKRMNMETENVSKAQTKRKRSMRNTVMMAAMSVVLLSGATYAWFTLSNTARVTNLSLGVVDSSGLLIADGEGPDGGDLEIGRLTYGNEFDMDMTLKRLSLVPATLASTVDTTDWVFYRDTQSDGTVTGLSADAVNGVKKSSSEDSTGHYYEKTFYLKVEAEGTYNISLVNATGTGNTLDGTYMLTNTSNKTLLGTTGGNTAAAAVRVAFYKDSVSPANLQAVYEPNANYTLTSGTVTTFAEDYDFTAADRSFDSYIDKAANLIHTQSTSGTFTDTGATSAGSNTLFTIKGGEDTKIIMRVWLEGRDEQCVNQISTSDILGQLKFASSK